MKFSELNIISIDPALQSTGVCCVVNKEINTFLISKKNEIYWNYQRTFNNIINVASRKYHLCLIEKPLMNKRQYEVVGIIKSNLEYYKLPYIEVHPDIWRHIMGVKQLLKGIKKKTAAGIRLYLDRVKSITCKSFDTTDEADAYMMYRAVCDIMDKPGKLTAAAENIRVKINEILN